ncbi:FKBP-type peptidyl-prolyl cis-trans isomerase [Pedobacter aquatilis]|uniref:FKBP-type peptidyl-prolyl cis-trans isomerase n=1 Tax=Pedobacter aquatilis TaxID=351343 RepID=UPI00292CF19D|nr:FKBP-type peptidyl-prolyl cis-trans isomerase [Pedobacter aquatilis]
MKNFTKLSLLSILAAVLLFTSCKKEYDSIQTIDDAKIASYIQKNNLSSVMVQDPDKTGFYYQVLTAGTGDTFKNTDSVLYNVTIKSMEDGTGYLQTPVTGNLATYVGYTSSFYWYDISSTVYNIPAIRTAILALKPGGVARILLPSYLAYGKNGAGNIPSNTVLDVTITTYPYKKQAQLDDDRIVKFLAAKGLTASAVKDPSGIYYIVSTQGAGTPIADKETSTAIVNYTGRLLSGTVFDSSTDGTFSSSFGVSSGIIAGWRIIIPKFAAGTKLRMIIPSNLAYSTRGSGTTIAPNTDLDFDIEIVSVTN